jgi:hypothetical protein
MFFHRKANCGKAKPCSSCHLYPSKRSHNFLLVVYYVFDLEWCKDALAVFLFIVSELLGRTTGQSKSSYAVNIFKNLLHSIPKLNISLKTLKHCR